MKKNYSCFDPTQLTCISASEQKAGKGQRGKQWISPKGSNLYFSLYYVLPKSFFWRGNLSQITSLWLVLALKEICQVQLSIKWPNDLFLGNNKIAGILIEIEESPALLHVITGIGINVDLSDEQLTSIDQPASFLSQQIEKKLLQRKKLQEQLFSFKKDKVKRLKDGLEDHWADQVNAYFYKKKEMFFKDFKHKFPIKDYRLDSLGYLEISLRKEDGYNRVKAGSLSMH